MNRSTSVAPDWGQVVSVPRCDRWSIYQRLQELNIPCACPTDGTLRVDVNHATALVLARSAIRQFMTSRADDIDWLDRCWETPATCKVGH